MTRLSNKNTLHPAHRKQTAAAALGLGVIILAAAVVYSNSLNAPFQFDDYPVIIKNTAIRSGLADIWRFNNRRFLGTLTFALNYRMHGLSVTGYHIFNVMVHIGASLAAAFLSMKLCETPGAGKTYLKHRRFIAVGTGLLFAVHPIQTQAVTYITQRYASLAAFFYLLSAGMFVMSRLSKGKRRIALMVLSFFAGLAAMFTKETAFTLPVSLGLIELFFFGDGIRSLREKIRSTSAWKAAVPFILLLLVIPALMSFNAGQFFASATSQRFGDPVLTPWTYLMTQFTVIPRYLFLVVIPKGLSVDHDVSASAGIGDTATLGGLFFIIAAIAAATVMFHRNRIVSFALIWIFLAQIVESGIKPLNNVMFEHRMYLPMFGAALAASAAIASLTASKNRRAALTILAVLTVVYGSLTVSRNRVWRSEVSLWSDAVAKAPEKARTRMSLGLAYLREGNPAEARDELETAVILNPGYVEGFINLGNARYRLGEIDEALEAYEHALALHPGDAEASNNLGSLALQRNDPGTARPLLETALNGIPDSPVVLSNMGRLALQEKDTDGALIWFEQALAIDPQLVDAIVGRGDAYFLLDRPEQAESSYREALDTDPLSAGAHTGLGNIHLNRMNDDEALREYTLALEADPANFAANKYAAVILIRNDNYEQAEHHLVRALKSREESETLIILGVLLMEQGRLDEAGTYLLRARDCEPKNLQAQAYLDRLRELKSAGSGIEDTGADER